MMFGHQNDQDTSQPAENTDGGGTAVVAPSSDDTVAAPDAAASAPQPEVATMSDFSAPSANPSSDSGVGEPSSMAPPSFSSVSAPMMSGSDSPALAAGDDATATDTASTDSSDASSSDAADSTNDSGSDNNSSDDTTSTATTPSGSDDLLGIKQHALQELAPLVDKLDQTPEEKFHTMMMMIQAADNQGLIQAAYDAAEQITDEKVRAQALLDIINEINYFTQHPAS